mmetsp:Transcript_26711/g.67124  ORF Transcript_26711/g.67124 Transcript_26711/m.67124 type:complete len:310 (+) Transcript_26711:271-1200(+)
MRHVASEDGQHASRKNLQALPPDDDKEHDGGRLGVVALPAKLILAELRVVLKAVLPGLGDIDEGEQDQQHDVHKQDDARDGQQHDVADGHVLELPQAAEHVEDAPRLCQQVAKQQGEAQGQQPQRHDAQRIVRHRHPQDDRGVQQQAATQHSVHEQGGRVADDALAAQDEHHHAQDDVHKDGQAGKHDDEYHNPRGQLDLRGGDGDLAHVVDLGQEDGVRQQLLGRHAAVASGVQGLDRVAAEDAVLAHLQLAFHLLHLRHCLGVHLHGDGRNVHATLLVAPPDDVAVKLAVDGVLHKLVVHDAPQEDW